MSPTPSNIVKTIAKTPGAISRGVMGLNRSNVNPKTIKAFKDLNIDVTAPILSESKTPALIENVLGKAPFFGSRIGKKYNEIDNQVKRSIEDTLDQLSPKRTPELEEKVDRAYDALKNQISREAKIAPNNLLEALDSIDIKSASNSASEKAVLKVMDDLRNAFDVRYHKDVKKLFPYDIPKIAAEPAQVNELWKAKTSLNSMIKDKDFADVRNLLKHIRSGLQKDIQAYGEINPEWGNLYKQTEDAYSRIKGRDKLQNLLIDDPTNFGSGTFSYNKLAKNITDPEVARRINLAVKEDPELLERIEKLGTIARAYSRKIARNPNPSGTAGTDKIVNYFLSGLGIGAGTGFGFVDPISTAVTAGTTAIGSTLLTEGLINKKFLNAAIAYTEKPNITNKMRMNRAIKDVTGLTPTIIARELEREQNEE